MESDHHFSSNPDCNNTDDVPSFLVVQLVLQFRLFLSDEVWKSDDSMIILHVKKAFGFCDDSRNFRRLFFLSPVKFWFYTDNIVSTEWRDLAPRQRICDCFEIHLPR